MVAEHPSIKFQIFVKTQTGKTITIDVDESDKVMELKNKIQDKERIPQEQQVLTYEGKRLEDDHKLSEYNLQKDVTVFQTGRLRGGVTEDELNSMLKFLNDKIENLTVQLNTATAQPSSKPKTSSTIIEAIRKGQMKEVFPKKFANGQTSGNFKVWAKEMKDYIFWHDKDTKDLIEHFENNWKHDEELTYADAKTLCEDEGLEIEVDKALHMILGAFLEGESKMLVETAELSNPDDLEMHKSGLELWRLLKFNFDRSSAFNVITILEGIRNMQSARNIQDVLPKIAALERSHQEYYRQAIASKDPEFVNLRASGASVYPEVFKKADLLKVLPDSIVKELKKSTNIDFEKNTYAEIRNIVNTIVHNHTSTAGPMDVDKKHVMILDKEESDQAQREDEATTEENYPVYDSDGGFVCYVGKGGGWQPKGKGKGKGKAGRFEGVCYNCGKTGHRSRDCWAKGGGKGDQKGKGNDANKGGYPYGGKGYGGKGKGLNAFGGQSGGPAFAPQPQPVRPTTPTSSSTDMDDTAKRAEQAHERLLGRIRRQFRKS